MVKKILSIAFGILFFVASAQEIPQLETYTLKNGLKVFLVSDPTTDKSAAALDVNVGMVISSVMASYKI